MAGARVTIDVDDRQVIERLDELIGRLDDPTPALRDIGEALLNSHHRRFEEQVAPDGTPWAPLSPAYQAKKKKNADKILVLDGYLSGLLTYQVSSDGLELGTNRIYGATHQFGDPARNIPERPWLGLSDDDRTEVLEILGDHLRG
jgi:phage virion morphogenesis protein